MENALRKNILSEAQAKAACACLTDYAGFCREGEWTDCLESGERRFSGRVWSRAFAEALGKCGKVYVPKMQETVYIEEPIVLKSGGVLWVHPETRICLLPNTNTCMVKNACADSDGRDADIAVCGGIWTTLTHDLFGKQNNGNTRGYSSKEDPLYGSHGVFLFRKAERIVLSGMTVTECAAFGVQMNSCYNFLVENVRFYAHKRDGIHLGGNVHCGEISNISGHTNDDLVALNAWDWNNYIMDYGDIGNIRVHDIFAERDQFRLLAGRHAGKNCRVYNVTFSNVHGVDNVKMYGQPNTESLVSCGREDISEGQGELENISFCGFELARPRFDLGPAVAELGLNAKNLTFSGVSVGCAEEEFTKRGYSFLYVGPKSQTLKVDAARPETWLELFEPDAVCTAQNVRIEGLRFASGENKKSALREGAMKVNTNYPATTPRGGNGRGKTENVSIR